MVVESGRVMEMGVHDVILVKQVAASSGVKKVSLAALSPVRTVGFVGEILLLLEIGNAVVA